MRAAPEASAVMAIVLTHEEQKLFAEGQPQGFPFGDFDVEDVMLPEGDDMGIASDDDEQHQEEEVPTESGFGSVIGAITDSSCSASRPRSAIGRQGRRAGTPRAGGGGRPPAHLRRPL